MRQELELSTIHRSRPAISAVAAVLTLALTAPLAVTPEDLVVAEEQFLVEEQHRRRPRMNAYTTRGQARIQQGDIKTVVRANRYLAGAVLAAFERQRGYHAEAEVEWLLRHNGVTPQAHTPVVALLRQRIGAALVRAGERLASVPGSGVSLETTPGAST